MSRLVAYGIDDENKFIVFTKDKYKKIKDGMKPKIGTKVYCIWQDSILIDTVEFIGSESFLLSNTHVDTYGWFYKDYGVNWFTDLKNAKDKLRSCAKKTYYDDNFTIVKVTDYLYELDWR